MFESSTSFASIPLQPVPRGWANSGPLSRNFDGLSGPIERGFLSGPIERGFMSGPIDKSCDQLQRSLSHHEVLGFKPKTKKGSVIINLKRAITKMVSRGRKSIVTPIRGVFSVKESNSVIGSEKNNENSAATSTNLSSHVSLMNDDDCDDYSMGSQNLQWAQGKAGEDRVHVVISEEHGWVFVGIYDGFNGPDAPDFLLSNLYPAVHKELKGLLWNDKDFPLKDSNLEKRVSFDNEFSQSQMVDSEFFDQESNPSENGKTMGKNLKNTIKLELNRKLNEQKNHSISSGSTAVDHSDVLKALSRALRKTEEAYLDIADQMLTENPELALMGSCVLMMLMKGEDVYLMNVGDSRAVLGQKPEPDFRPGKAQNLHDDRYFSDSINSLQLTVDHSTCVEEEVERIKSEHPDDSCAVMNDRVKGSLKVTRAFGAGFLKQPKWNNALLEMFRIEYVGTAPYISCFPWLYHHRLDHRDRFLILSSDGLYQYFTNEEAVNEVELFISSWPEGDPAQHLVEEVLFRAAKKAGMDFHELLDIPQGDRRKYHDDVSVIVISLEGRIWRSSA